MLVSSVSSSFTLPCPRGFLTHPFPYPLSMYQAQSLLAVFRCEPTINHDFFFLGILNTASNLLKMVMGTYKKRMLIHTSSNSIHSSKTWTIHSHTSNKIHSMYVQSILFLWLKNDITQYSKRYHWSSHDGMLEKQWNTGGMCAMPHQLSNHESSKRPLWIFIEWENKIHWSHYHIQAENI